MARKKPRSTDGRSTRPARSTRKNTYSAGEWFMVLIGALLVILFAGIIITSIFGQ
jgi:hypothetical protein